QLHELRADPAALVLKDKAGDLLIEGGENKILPGEDTRDEPGIGDRAVEDKVDQGVLLQCWAESSEDSVSHSLMAAACGRSQDVSKTRLTITASGFGCPYPNSAPSPPPWGSPPPPCSCRPHPPRSRRWNGLPPRLRQA